MAVGDDGLHPGIGNVEKGLWVQASCIVLCTLFCYNDACHVTDIGVTSEVGGKIDKIRLGDLG
jgi:hypothetical protein